MKIYQYDNIISFSPGIHRSSQNSFMQWFPWLNQCVETMNYPSNCILTNAYAAENLLKPSWTQDSSRKQSNLVEEKPWCGVTYSMSIRRFPHDQYKRRKPCTFQIHIQIFLELGGKHQHKVRVSVFSCLHSHMQLAKTTSKLKEGGGGGGAVLI